MADISADIPLVISFSSSSRQGSKIQSRFFSNDDSRKDDDSKESAKFPRQRSQAKILTGGGNSYWRYLQFQKFKDAFSGSSASITGGASSSNVNSSTETPTCANDLSTSANDDSTGQTKGSTIAAGGPGLGSLVSGNGNGKGRKSSNDVKNKVISNVQNILDQRLFKEHNFQVKYPHHSVYAEYEDYDNIPTFPPRPSFKDFENALRINSQVVVFDGCPADPYKPSSTPLYQTSTFRAPDSSSFGEYDYTRSGNPTRTALEKHVAMLERATVAFAFTSGMAALSIVTRLAADGEILCGDDIYGGMYRLITKVAALQNIDAGFVPTYDLKRLEQIVEERIADFESGKRPRRVKVLHMETPSNPLLRISDIAGIAKICKKHGILLSVDATLLSPLLIRPLDLGADIVIHSATKWISGHADTMGGIVALSDQDLANKIGFHQNAEGTALAPFDCWLMLRGIKTLAIRLERSLENSRKIAKFLSNHEAVKKVYWTERLLGKHAEDVISLSEEVLHKQQAFGTGCMISFETGDEGISKRFMEACRIFKITVSFGSVNSLVEMPIAMSHASIPAGEGKVVPLAGDLLRLSIGIEDVDDLIEDLSQAFETALKMDDTVISLIVK